MENYRNRISGPLLDRNDIHVEAPAVEFKELSSDERAEPSVAIREGSGGEGSAAKKILRPLSLPS